MLTIANVLLSAYFGKSTPPDALQSLVHLQQPHIRGTNKTEEQSV